MTGDSTGLPIWVVSHHLVIIVSIVPKGKDKSGRVSVFKGREAKLNKATFQALALKNMRTIYNIHKEVRAERGSKTATRT